MTFLRDVLALLDQTLEPARFSDYCPNGLQVEGRAQVNKIVTGVTASQALIDAAVACGADAVLVHHGYFWKGEDARITGMKKARLKTLLDNDISLLAYHLPLDAHPQLGNNAQLAKILGLTVDGPLEPGNPRSVGNTAVLPVPLSATDFASHIALQLGRQPQVIAAGPPAIRLAEHRDILTKPLRSVWMRILVGRFPSRRCMQHGSAASITSPAGTMQRSVMV